MKKLKQFHVDVLRLAVKTVKDSGLHEKQDRLLGTVYANLMVDIRNKFFTQHQDVKFDSMLNKMTNSMRDLLDG